MKGRQYTHSKISQLFASGYKSLKAFTVSLLAFINHILASKFFPQPRFRSSQKFISALRVNFHNCGNLMAIISKSKSNTFETKDLSLGVEKLKIRKLIK